MRINLNLCSWMNVYRRICLKQFNINISIVEVQRKHSIKCNDGYGNTFNLTMHYLNFILVSLLWFENFQSKFHSFLFLFLFFSSRKDWQLNTNFNNSMASAVPDSCCKSYEPQCAQKPYGKHPSNIFYEV